MATKPTKEVIDQKILIEDTDNSLTGALRVKKDHPVIYPLSIPENEERTVTPAIGQSATRPDAKAAWFRSNTGWTLEGTFSRTFL